MVHMKIHPNILEAQKALNEFEIELDKLEEEYGASLYQEDDCAGIWYEVEYYDQNGNVKTLP